MVISLPNYVHALKAPHLLVGECISLYCADETDGASFVPVLCVILQKKAQTQQTREFHTKSIKEKAVHLTGLFSGDSTAVLKVTISSLCVTLTQPWPCVLHYLPITVWFFLFACGNTSHLGSRQVHAANFVLPTSRKFRYNNSIQSSMVMILLSW